MVAGRGSQHLQSCLSWYEVLRESLAKLDEEFAWTLQGQGALALAEGRLHALTGDRQWLERARRSLECGIQSGMALENASLSLHEGFSGICWVARLLNRLLEPQEQFDVSDIDDALLDYFSRADDGSENLDLIVGASGFAVYATAHPDPGFRARIFDGFVSLIESRLLHWDPQASTEGSPLLEDSSPNRGANTCLSNSGLAHGMPGILAVLARIAASAENPSANAGLIRRLVASCAGGIRAAAGREYVGYVRGDPTPARSAWCYGEPGYAAALGSGAAAIGDEPLQQRATALFCSSILEKDPEQWLLDEIGICHGWSGILLASRHISGFHVRPDDRLSRISGLASARISQVVDAAMSTRALPRTDAGSFSQAQQDASFLGGGLGVLHVLLDGLEDRGQRTAGDLPWRDCLLL